jgi:pentose-5-phosphate-3-epimerase
MAPVFDAIRAARRHAGICIRVSDSPDLVRPWLAKIDYVLLLAIAEPGRSGQDQDPLTPERIAAINAWPERSQLTLCVDGGVNERTIERLDVEHVVSASSVLNHPDPRRQLLRLQTGSAYDAS